MDCLLASKLPSSIPTALFYKCMFCLTYFTQVITMVIVSGTVKELLPVTETETIIIVTNHQGTTMVTV